MDNKYSDIYIIIAVSFVLFAVRFFFCRIITPEIIFANDYFLHIKLGQNIVENGGSYFISQVGIPLIYPPLYSVVIQILTVFTDDALKSIQLINIFCTSFCLVPLFSAVKRISGRGAAYLTILWLTLYLEIAKPCFYPFSDYSFMFWIIVVFWYLSKFASDKKAYNYHFIILGILIGLAWLTKWQGIYLCIPAVFVMFSACHHEKRFVKIILKRVSILLLGLLPLMILFQSMFVPEQIKASSYKNGTYTFFDGNYFFEKEREKKIYALNASGDDFAHLSVIQDTSPHAFIKEHPSYMLKKYFFGLRGVSVFSAQSIVPFTTSFIFETGLDKYLNGALLILLCISLICFKNRKDIILIALFLMPVLFVPIYFVTKRYLLPFMPYYFTLFILLFGKYMEVLRPKIGKVRLNWIIASIYAMFIAGMLYLFVPISYKRTIYFMQYPRLHIRYYQAAADFIIKDYRKFPDKNLKVMARRTVFSYLTNAEFIALPYENNWARIAHFARLRDVDYIVLDQMSLVKNRRDQWQYFLQNDLEKISLKKVYDSQNTANKIRVYRVLD